MRKKRLFFTVIQRLFGVDTTSAEDDTGEIDPKAPAFTNGVGLLDYIGEAPDYRACTVPTKDSYAAESG